MPDQMSLDKYVSVDDFCIFIDDEDRHLLGRGTWRVSRQGVMLYVKWHTTVKGRTVTYYLHREICGAKKGQIVDHINGDTLDNRRANLRVVSSQENATNCSKISRRLTSSRFKGVDLHKGRWRARIRVNGKPMTLGGFGSEEAAAGAYDIASLKFHGEYGRRNFLPLA